MMSLPPTKKTAPKTGSIHTTNFDKLQAMTFHGSLPLGASCHGKPPPKPPAEGLSSPQEQEVIMNSNRWVSVEEAAEYAGVSARTMWDLVKVNAVISDHPLGINRTRVDLDSVDELNRSPERKAEAKEKMRRLREGKKTNKKREDGNGGKG